MTLHSTQQSSHRSTAANQTISLPFGVDSRCELPFGSAKGCDEKLIAYVGRPKGDPIKDPLRFVMSALDDPIGFPPLIEATVPGDRVAIAVGNGIRQVAQIVAGIVETLSNGRVEPADICVVLPKQDHDRFRAIQQDVISILPTEIGKAITFQLHDPSDRNQLSYLAVASDASPILFNRTIGEADLVIPVGCLRPPGTLGYIDDAMGLFPTFADAETIRSFSSPSAWLTATQQTDHYERAREAAWLLGVTFTVQILPGAGDEVLRVFAGEKEAVFAAGRDEMRSAWACSVPRRSSLVVAAIEGGADQQTWVSFASALSASLKVVDDNGAVVICSELADHPGTTLLKIRGIDRDSDLQFDEIEQAVADDASGDAFVAAQLIEALRRVRIYLFSHLDAELVEELGIAPVTRTEEIANLCQRSTSCILIANAQHAVPILDDEVD